MDLLCKCLIAPLRGRRTPTTRKERRRKDKREERRSKDKQEERRKKDERRREKKKKGIKKQKTIPLTPTLAVDTLRGVEEQNRKQPNILTPGP